MKHDAEYEDDWKAEAPFLAGLDKEVDPEVPDGYFEELPTAVMARIRAMQAAEKPMQVVSKPVAAPTPARILGLRGSVFWSAAAGIVLLATVGIYFLTQNPAGTGGISSNLETETLAQLSGLGTDEVIEDLGAASLNDEQLFAMLGPDGHDAFEGEDHEVQRDDAYEYLQDVDLDAVDLQGLDIDLNDLQ